MSLSLLCKRGKEEERATQKRGNEEKVPNKGHTHTDTHTHPCTQRQTLARSQRGTLCLALSIQACQIYSFVNIPAVFCTSHHRSVCFWISALSECVCVCVLWIRKGSGCQGTRACGILRRLASHGAAGAQVLGKSPAEVKSAVTEMKGGSPAATPPTDLRVKNEKGSRRLWEVRPEEVFYGV